MVDSKAYNKGLTQAVTVFLPPANMSQVGIWSSSVTVIISSRMPRNIFGWILPLRSLTENNYLTRWCCFVSMCSTVCFYHRKQIKLRATRKRRVLWCQLCLVKQIWCSIITSYIFMHQKEVQPAEMINEDLEVLNKIFLHTGFFENAVDWRILKTSRESMKTARSSSSNPPTGNQSTFWMPEDRVCKVSHIVRRKYLYTQLSEWEFCTTQYAQHQTDKNLSEITREKKKSKIIIQVCLMFFWKAALCGAVTVHHCALSNHQE